MSNFGYFSDMFHDLGDLSIELDNALNVIVRAYRTKVSDEDKEKAREKLLTFLSLLLEEGEGPVIPLSLHHLKKILKDFIAEQRIISKVNSIRRKIESEETLSESEINVMDDLISQVSGQAAMAFRRMRKVI
ncbi:MAG: hypothetical protein GTN82_43050 [Candidatus Aminicenantes bacterium]|nr:hypothetical protein [Candidatus Aminicenantes bacterium]NIN23557.1 hypothetical protein [Candidatus Aminicenantes bacterium]NIR12228.1 hypothetical protein [Candidatus Aminicenantes bacterium]